MSNKDALSQEIESTGIENLVIVGSGPAGFTAAIYAARANLQPLLITGFNAGGIPGGQLMTTTFVENFPGFPNGVKGPELMDLIKSQALRWGTKLLEADLEEVVLSQRPFLLKAGGKTLNTQALIIATGARANRLNLPSEKFFWSKGISACAICDGATPQFRNEELGVVGGGDSACEEAVYLTKFGSHVHLFVRANSLKASAAMSDRVFSNSQISIHFGTRVLDVYGDDWLRGVRLEKADINKEELIDIRGLFYAIGHTPNSSVFSGQLECDSNGYIATEPGRTETSVPGVFAAGDVVDDEWRQGITAAGTGCMASLSAERWLSKNNLANLIKRVDVEPESVKNQIIIEVSSEDNYHLDAPWQRGSYALRRLYHETEKPLLVVYTSPNCGPCHVLKPQILRVLNEFKGLALGVEINIEDDQEIALQAGVNGTPTLQLFKNKQMIIEWKGVKQRSEIKQAIQEIL